MRRATSPRSANWLRGSALGPFIPPRGMEGPFRQSLPSRGLRRGSGTARMVVGIRRAVLAVQGGGHELLDHWVVGGLVVLDRVQGAQILNDDVGHSTARTSESLTGVRRDDLVVLRGDHGVER